LTTGAAAFTAFKALDYSLFRAAKEMLYIPLSFDARYRAKSVIDAFGYRAAKGGMSGLLAAVGRCSGGIAAAAYPLVAIVAAGLWLPLALSLTGHARTESAGTAPNR
jgi:ATP/ADP translocase